MSEQSPSAGQLSEDQRWYWNGTAWMPATSLDCPWRWDGRQWVPLSPSRPPWSTGDRLALGGWAVVSIAASVICNQLLFRGGGVRGSASFVTFLALAPFAFGIAGGVLIRRAAPMTEVFWLAAYGAAWPAVSLFVAWAGDSTACTAPAGSGCDTGLGLGAVLVFAGCYVPSLAGVALGKVLGAGRGRTGRSA